MDKGIAAGSGRRRHGKWDKIGGGVQNGLDLHLGDFGVGDGHTDRAVAEHRVLFLFQAAVVREELVERSHPKQSSIRMVTP